MTHGSAFFLADDANGFGNLNLNLFGHAIKITAGTGAGQMRTISRSFSYQVDVDDPWVTPPDATSQYIILHGSGGEGRAGVRYDGAFTPGKNLAVTLAGYRRRAPGNYLGSFTDQWDTLAHEIGHLTTLMHGGSNHVNYKADYVSLMNYAYDSCVAPNVGRDASGNPLPGAASCPINNYSLPTDIISDDWRNLDLRSSLNFQVMGNAFGPPPDPPTSPFTDKPIGSSTRMDPAIPRLRPCRS